MNEQMWTISDEDKKIILSLLSKGKAEQEKNDKFAVIEFDDFYKLFTSEEITMLKKFLSIDPKQIDYKLPFIGIDSNINNLITIPNQIYVINDIQMKLPSQYLPKTTFEAYQKLNKAITKDIGKKLLVQYGYRSPARQAFIFFDILERIFNFDFNQTLTRVCLPEYSEHVCSKRQAIDFMTEDGVKGNGFEKTEEYIWLKNNASKFDFYESYQEDNNLGMVYEPWHWHHEI